jgi:hypothetical protein
MLYSPHTIYSTTPLLKELPVEEHTGYVVLIWKYSRISWEIERGEGGIHKVGRVLSYFSSRRNWNSPNPSPAPSLWFRGEGHTHWRERGWESPNSDEGTYTVVLYICLYFVGVLLRQPHSFLQQAAGQILKDDVNSFPPPPIFAPWGNSSTEKVCCSTTHSTCIN